VACFLFPLFLFVKKTFWLDLKNDASQSIVSSESGTAPPAESESSLMENTKQPIIITPSVEEKSKTTTDLDSKTLRLIEWNTHVLSTCLQGIASHRRASGSKPEDVVLMKLAEKQLTKPNSNSSSGSPAFLDEVKGGIPAPTYIGTERRDNSADTDSSTTTEPLDPAVMDQLRLYVKSIANGYREHSFHSFEHCSHVTMSAYQLLNRITAPADQSKTKDDQDTPNNTTNTLHHHHHDHHHQYHHHQYPHGVVTVIAHPLTQLAILLSALVHDVEHSGVPNTTLVREQETMAQRYHGTSVAEQHSLEMAWNLLLQDCYKDLRRAMYWNKDELQQFRSILDTAVLATDIADPALNDVRNARWNTVFPNGSCDLGIHSHNHKDDKIATTLIIECIMQASDIAHTMQHFQVYIKWNKRLFREMDLAYRQGRTTRNPVECWYQGELQFFDEYVIPLVQKLKDCGIFGGGAAGGGGDEEYLRYGLSNRATWEEKGQELVAEFVTMTMATPPGASSFLNVVDEG
jgi:hypothetical protein